MTRSLGAGEAATIRPKRPFCDDGAELRKIARVLVGNLRSEILVVQPAQNRHRQRATGSLNGTRDRRVLLQR
jgi:hypothetical protein